MGLKELLGEELYGQIDSKIQEHNKGIEDKTKHAKLVDLSEGAYVSVEKFQTLETKSSGLETQLNEANSTINSYKEMDIDGIKNSVKEWEEKYNADTQKLKEDMETKTKMFAAEKYLDGHKIKSALSKKSILQEFMSKGFEFKNDQFVGADDYMKTLKEQYPDDFEKEEEEGKQNSWVRGTRGTYKPETKSEEEAYLAKKYGGNKYAK